MRADEQTDMTKLIVAFHSFGNALKVCAFFPIQAMKAHRGVEV